MPNKTKSGKSSQARSGSSKKKTSAKKTTARKADVQYESPSRKKSSGKKPKAPKYTSKHFMISMVLGAVALFIVSCYAFPQWCGLLGEYSKDFMFGMFGGGAIVLPVLLFVEAVCLKHDVENSKVASRAVSSAVALVFVSALLHAAGAMSGAVSALEMSELSANAFGEFYESGTELAGGGIIGGAAGTLIMGVIGPVGTIMVAALLVLFCAIFVLGISFGDVRMKYVKWQEKKAIKNEARAEAAAKRVEEAAIASKREELRQAELEKEAAAERKRKEDEEREIDRIRKSTQAHNERASQIRREIDVKKAEAEVYDADDELETDEMPRTRKHGDVDEIFRAGLIEETVKPVLDEDAYDEYGIDGDKEFQGASVDEFWLENDPDSETTFVDIPNMGESTEMMGVDGEGYETINAGEEIVTAEGTYEGATGETQEIGITGETPIPEDAIPWENVMNGEVETPEYATGEVTAEVTGEIPTGVTGEIDADITDEIPTEADEALDPVADELRRTLDAARTAGQAASAAGIAAGAVSAPPTAEAVPEEPAYIFPPLDLLESDPNEGVETEYSELQENADILIETLKNFKVNARVVDIFRGPTITRYEIALATGTRVNTVKNLADDISYALATNGVRIEQIPGKSAIGIEVPNLGARDTVYLRTLLEDEKFTGAKSKLTAALGKGVSGENVYFDIAKMPHLLIAGTTGSGKSVCINTVLISLLYKATPDEVKLVLVDPKKVELNIYNGIPHLLVPVVFDPKKAAGALHWCVTEMDRRFDLIESMNVRNIEGYNKAIADDPKKEKLPQIVIVIDELADLMMTASNEVETSICRIAQKARAAGMHLIIGTQRPSVDVITGLIKANVPSRIAFTVMSQVDSRTIIDQVGAEKLIGRGDMLFAPVGSKPVRAQGAFVSDSELEGIIDFIKKNSKKAEYSGEIISRIDKEAALCGKKGKARDEAMEAMDDEAEEEDDPKLDAAIKLAVESGKISTSLIQRKLSLGYGRAAKIIDVMERRGIVAPPEGQKPREVLISKEQYLEMSMRKEGASGSMPRSAGAPVQQRQMQRTGEVPMQQRQMQRTGEIPMQQRQMQRTGEVPMQQRQMQRTGEVPMQQRQMQRTGEIPMQQRQMQRTGEVPMQQRQMQRTGEVPMQQRQMQRTGEVPMQQRQMQRTGEIPRTREDFPEDEI